MMIEEIEKVVPECSYCFKCNKDGKFDIIGEEVTRVINDVETTYTEYSCRCKTCKSKYCPTWLSDINIRNMFRARYSKVCKLQLVNSNDK